ncbi:phosphorothioated DNA-binding restriction endonuclease [Streptomyces decoyicus]|uniref:phosphorothioated DNA-binding restriction endonuclease n=1 Tax=Streptomyces decoyicus TaxID=249567 RepID=UPI0004AB1926|nr:HNH endonuclease [Streptomyces decoyicus]KOG40570.1 restriction endonuclease [Streptomyces decoyicus]QZY17838.1 HNH endonuclease [Streptomyces decoyicus]
MDWIERVGNLRQWAQNGARAPHKPLLMLYALGRFQRNPRQSMRYSEIEHDLSELLQDYGPTHRTSPSYPFHHLVSDGVWEVRTDSGAASPGTGVRGLRESGARGQLVPGLRAALAEDGTLLGQLAQLLLDKHFPPSIHPDIAAAVGLDLDQTDGARASSGQAPARRRAAELRRNVLIAYEYRCAFCGFDGSIGRVPVGLEAAHVQWWAFQGPDDLANCLCLCSLHHKLFDRGVLGLDSGRRITVSREFVGQSPAARHHVLDLTGRALIGPQNGSARVAPAYVMWHTAQVFRGQPRIAEHAVREQV